uniref:Uncharacterized protein n=1 Tax=Nelumbo nucifera TaxID=4432 RepID=A0A823A0F9_NELNU|nr:TPA_asm: hypothetical protein HUJ06_018474 [Nelumbo nucifera]
MRMSPPSKFWYTSGKNPLPLHVAGQIKLHFDENYLGNKCLSGNDLQGSQKVSHLVVFDPLRMLMQLI